MRSNSESETAISLVWALLIGKRLRVGIVGVISVAEGFLEALVLFLFARLAVGVVTGSGDALSIPGLNSLSNVGTNVLLLVLVVSRFSLSLVGSYLMTEIERSVSLRLRSTALDAYARSGWEAQVATSDGALQQVLLDLPNKAVNGMSTLLKNSFQIFSLCSMLLVAAISSPLLTAFLLLSVLGVSGLFIPIRKLIKRLSTRVISHQRALSSSAAELARMKTELQTFGVMEVASLPLADEILLETGVARRLSFLKSLVVPMYILITFGAVSLALILLQGTSSETVLSVGPTVLIVVRSLSYGQSVQTLGVAIASIGPILTSLRAEATRLETGKQINGTLCVEHFARLTLSDVHVSYATGAGSVLTGVSMTLCAGERVGVVGPSGGGKTSLLRILLGILRPDEGELLINGMSADEISWESWRRLIAFVPQQAQLMNASVRVNLSLFRGEFSDDEMWEALEVASLARVVRNLPSGLDTRVGPSGWSLSGGEQQRLAIARAVLSQPRILFMDEPTASLDVDSEREVVAALSKIPSEVCLVIVSHRSGILAGCDRLMVVDGGRIAADGSRSEVLAVSQFAQNLAAGALK